MLTLLVSRNTIGGRRSQPNVNGAHSATLNSSSSQSNNNAGQDGRIDRQPFHAEHYQARTTSYTHTGSSQQPTCPYHAPILNMNLTQSSRGQGLGPMDRFMAEGSSEQSALFNRADTGKTSTWRECTCYTQWQSGSSRQA